MNEVVPAIRTNGHSPQYLSTLAQAMRVSTQEVAETVETVETVGDPFSTWAWMEGKTSTELQDATLARKEELVALDPFAVASLLSELNKRGVSKTWTERTLKPALNKSRKQETAGRLTWHDYADAIENLGYAVSINDLTEGLEINGQPVSDTTEATIFVLLHEKGLANRDLTKNTLLAIGNEKRRHPIKDFFNSLTWDGNDHIAHLATYFKDAHTPITYQDGTRRSVFEAVLRRYFVGAVGKVFDPDNVQNIVPILDGAQDKGKSTFIKWISPKPELHAEEALDLHNKDHKILATNVLVWELPEVGALVRKADRELLKAFLTNRYHTVRPPYGHRSIRKPATASFIASVNLDGALLNDKTGHRRFFPLTLLSIDWAHSTNIDVHQLWAQAVYLFRAGEPWRLTPEEKAKHAEIAKTFEVEDPIEGLLLKYFHIDENDVDSYMFSADILEHLKDSAKLKTDDDRLMAKIGSVLGSISLQRTQRRRGGHQTWGYIGISKKSITDEATEDASQE